MKKRPKKMLKSYKWFFGVCLVIAGLLSLAVVMNIALVSYLPYKWKLKVVHVEIAIINFIFCYFCFVKLIKKVVVTDLGIENKSDSLLWRGFWTLIMFFAQMSFFTKFWQSSEPFMLSILSWLCYGTFWLVLMFILVIKCLCYLINKTFNSVKFLNKKTQSYATIALTFYFATVSLFNALEPPIIKK